MKRWAILILVAGLVAFATLACGCDENTPKGKCGNKWLSLVVMP